jgi:transcriptional regulator with XRE-family HTH domain
MRILNAKNPHTHLHQTKRKSDRSSRQRAQKPNLGTAIRTRRRELCLTQANVASNIKVSRSYVGYLESGERHPSNLIVTRLAKVLGLDGRELFFLANQQTKPALPDLDEVPLSVLGELRKHKQLRRVHNVSHQEMEMLSRLLSFGCDLGRIHSLRDLIYILNTIRNAVGRTAIRQTFT